MPLYQNTLQPPNLGTLSASQIPNAYWGSQALLETKWIYTGKKERKKWPCRESNHEQKEYPYINREYITTTPIKHWMKSQRYTCRGGNVCCRQRPSNVPKFAAIKFPHLGCHVAAESQECNRCIATKHSPLAPVRWSSLTSSPTFVASRYSSFQGWVPNFKITHPSRKNQVLPISTIWNTLQPRAPHSSDSWLTYLWPTARNTNLWSWYSPAFEPVVKTLSRHLNLHLNLQGGMDSHSSHGPSYNSL
jgi:hypothetical protein